MKEMIEAQKNRQGKAQGESFELDLAIWFLIDQYIEYQEHKASGYSFNFFPGLDDIEKWEDVVIRYEKNAREQIIFVQAKHVLNPNKSITDRALFLLDGDYSLLMYCNAYLKAKNNQNFLQQIGCKNLSSNVELILATSKVVTSQYLKQEKNNQKLNIGNRDLYKPDINIIPKLIEAFKVGAIKDKNKLTALNSLNDSELAEGIDEFLSKLIFVTNLPRQGTEGNKLENIIKNEQIAKIKINEKLLKPAEIDEYFKALQYLIFRRKGENKTLITPEELDELFSDQKQKLNELLINREHSKKLEALNVSFTEESIKDLRNNTLQDFLLPEKRVLNIITSALVLQDLKALEMQPLTIEDLATLPKLKMLAESIIPPKTSKNQYNITLFKQNDLHLVFIEGNASDNSVQQKLKENLETIISTKDLKFKAIFISTFNLLEEAKSKDALKKNPFYNFFEDLNNKSLYESIELEQAVDKKTVKEFITEKKQILHLISLDSIELGYAKLNQILCDSTMHTNDVFFIDLDSLLKNHSKFLSILSKYSKIIIECNISIINHNSNQILLKLLDNNTYARIILLTKEGCNVQDILPKQQAEPYEIKHNFGDLKLTDQKNLLTRKMLTFLGNKEEISLQELMGISDLDQYLSDIQKQDNLNQIIPIKTLVQLIKNEEIKIGSDSTGTSDLVGAYAQLYQDIDTERFINSLLLEDDHIFVISGIHGSEKSKSFIDKLKSFNKGLPVDNIENQICDFHPDTQNSSRILLDDDKLQEKHFKQLCRVNSDKKIYWISLKDGSDNASPCMLQQIYNPSFYVDRQFNHFKKVIITEKIYEELGKQNYDIFLFAGVDNQDDLLKLVPENNKTLVEQNLNNDHPRVLIANKRDGQSQFDTLVAQNRYKPIHYLEIEQNNDNTQMVWIKSHGTLENLRQHIDKKSIKETVEKDFMNYIKDKQAIIMADDPGMGKTTSLTKLCTLQYNSGFEAKSIFQSYWTISVDLKDHISTIGTIKSPNIKIDDIINLCSEADSDLSKPFAQKILPFAFKNTNFIKPILIKFDGFDEILDQNIRDKIISLIQYLKYDPNAQNVKFWITSRLHYEHTLENALSTFAIKFEPLDDPKKKEFIYKFLKDRLHLTLSTQQFHDTFGDDVAKVHDETSQIGRFANGFLVKMQDIFKGDSTKFIGTPLQLYLMLERSTQYFKKWIKNDPDKSPDFDYLGTNILSVYEEFIENIYDIYLKRTEVKTTLLQKERKDLLDQHHQGFAESLILNSGRKKSFEKFRDIVLSAGIIKSHGSNIEFIHPTFREYFAAQVFMHWLEEEPTILVNSNQQKYLLTEIFIKPEYQVVRTFINLHLEKFMQNNTSLPQETLQQYGKLMDNLWEPRLNPLIINYDQTILYIAVVEGNIQVINFILDSIYDSETVLTDFLTKKTSVPHDTVFERNVLYIAAKQVLTEKLKATQGRGDIEKQELYENIIEIFLAITNGKAEMQKKMLLATFFHPEYAKDPVNKYLFDYIHTKYSNNDSLKAITDLLKEKEHCIKKLEAIWKKGDKINMQDLADLSSKVLDQEVMSALLKIQFSYNTDASECILHRAVEQEFGKSDMSDRLNIVKWLIENGADVNAINNCGNSILHVANTPDIIHFLLKEKNVYVHVIDKEGCTSLHHLANTSDDASSMIHFLVEQGIDVNAKNNLGQTALHCDPNSGPKNFDNFKALVTLDADIDVPDNYGWTALHTIVATESWDCLKFLMTQNKGDVYARNENGHSVLDMAYSSLRQNPQSAEKVDMLKGLSELLDNYSIEAVSTLSMEMLFHPCTNFISSQLASELFALAKDQF